MKQWKRMAALAVALAAGAAHAGDWAGKEIRLAVDPTYPPLEYKLPDGTLTGFRDRHHERLVRGTACALRVGRVEFRRDDPGAARAQVRRDRVVDDDHAEAAAADRLHEPDLQCAGAPRRAQGSPLLPTADALKGKRVGVEQGSAQADYAVANWQPAGVQVVSYQNRIRSMPIS